MKMKEDLAEFKQFKKSHGKEKEKKVTLTNLCGGTCSEIILGLEYTCA